MFLAFIIFIIPLGTGLYLWRENEAPRKIYYITFFVSFLAMIVLSLGISDLLTVMSLGIFLSATSFFAGTFLSVFVRAYYKNKSSE